MHPIPNNLHYVYVNGRVLFEATFKPRGYPYSMKLKYVMHILTKWILHPHKSDSISITLDALVVLGIASRKNKNNCIASTIEI